MALWYITTVLPLAFSLMSPFVVSLSGSGGRMESGRVYLVAPDLEDCPMNTDCDTLSSYSAMATSQVSDVIYSFLPGIHKLSQNWTITTSSNITIRGAGDADEKNETIVDICESGSVVSIQVRNSEQIAVEGIRITTCGATVESLYLESTSGATVSHVSIECSSRINSFGLQASNCADLTIKSSSFSNCKVGLVLLNVYCGIIDDIVLLNNYAGLYLRGFFPSEEADSYLMNIHLNNYACIQRGNVTFRQLYIVGNVYGLYDYLAPYPEWLNRFTRVHIVNSTLKTGSGTSYAIYVTGIFQNSATNIESISVSGNSAGFTGIIIRSQEVYAGSLAENASVRIHNVTIENIRADTSSLLTLSIPGALMVSSFWNLTLSNSTIKNNGVTGILLYDTTAFLQGNITLTNNSGINGGGMSFFPNSFIVMDSSTSLTLTNNSAEQFGGGIYVSQDLLWLEGNFSAYCFACSIDENFQPIIFEGNRAGASGHNLYGGYIQNCVLPIFNNENTTQTITYGDKGSENCNQSIISSDPIKLLPCSEYCVNDSENSTKQYDLSLFPGQDFSVRIAAVGQLNGLTPAIILFSSRTIILDETSPNTTQSFDTGSIHAQCTKVTQTLALREYVDEAVMYIAIADETLPSFVNTPIEVYVEVKPCPPGFDLSKGICDCTNSIQDLATCNITSESIQRNGNSWIYPRNDSIMIFNNCPFDYCNNKTMSSGDPDEQCAHNRAGILCGECIPGYSMILGSNECQNCTDKLWQLPLIVLGSVLAGIGLVAAFIAINLTVSVGTINGLIFFVNIVNIYKPIFATNTFHPILHYFISWLNLDLGITSCFIPGMTACVKVGLQFVFPLYLLSIVAFIIVICKAGQWPVLSSSRFIRFVSGKVTLLIGSKAIPVLATLLLLSYTKLLRNTILIFHKATVITADCDKNTSSSTCENFVVWYVDGNITYTSSCHGILFGVAVGIFSPLVVLFTSFLLFFPLMERYLPRFKWWSSWHMRLKPWYDAYGGPYRDEYRSWTGMLLLVRCVLALVAALENDPLVNTSVLAWSCLLLISLLSLTQVYKTFLFNSLEMMYLASLLLMAFLSTTYDGQSDVVLIFVLCSFLLIITFHLRQQLVKLKRIQLLVYKVKKNLKNLRSNEAQEEKYVLSCDVNRPKHSTTIVRLHHENFNECREPLLEQEL